MCFDSQLENLAPDPDGSFSKKNWKDNAYST